MTVSVISDNTGADFSGTDDNAMQENTPGQNNGSSTTNAQALWATGDTRMLLIRFTGLSNLAGESASAATFSQYQSSNINGGSADSHRMRKLLRAWTEGNSNWSNWDTSQAWTTGGAGSDGNDRSATVTADRACSGTNGEYKDFSSAQLVTDVQDILDGGANNGWRVGFVDETNVGTKEWTFVSSEGTDGQRPKLTVTHAAGGGGAIEAAGRRLALLGVC